VSGGDQQPSREQRHCRDGNGPSMTGTDQRQGHVGEQLPTGRGPAMAGSSPQQGDDGQHVGRANYSPAMTGSDSRQGHGREQLPAGRRPPLVETNQVLDRAAGYPGIRGRAAMTGSDPQLGRVAPCPPAGAGPTARSGAPSAAAPQRLLLGALGLLALVLMGASLARGEADLGALPPELARTILIELRLPRALLAAAIGAALGLTGAAMQALLRNPLASPDVVGSSAGAGLGAVVAGYLLAGGSSLAFAAGGVAGALVALALLWALAGAGAGTATLILAGIAVSALAGALTSLALSLAPSPFALYDAFFWLLGGLEDRSLAHVAVALPLIAAGAALIAPQARALDRLTLGEEVAQSLGTSLVRLRWAVLGGTALAVGGSVAVAGSIGFIGLVAPHLVRPLVGHRPAATLLPAALAGACLLAADLATRAAPPGVDLKLGVLTALIGAPFFLWLILKGRGHA
jgi:iron complex transport system permease protein